MDVKNFALILYILTVILATTAVAFGNDTLRLFSNPVVIPAITFYYIFDRIEKFSVYYGLVLFLCFAVDTLVFLELDVVLYIMVPSFLCYLILFYFIIQDLRGFKFNKIGFAFSIIIFSALLFLLINILKSLAVTIPKLVVPGFIYGLFLILFASFGIYYFLVNRNAVAKYLLFFILLSLFSDIFYVVFKLITSLRSLVYIEFSAQLISYYFLVKYFSNRKVLD